ncbi:hypothetical protein DFH06DRAFT_1173652 [Mycena polygramma]|nr:hypothetical protein DFH06DRAFT_1173652 [Mycena polygramma]
MRHPAVLSLSFRKMCLCVVASDNISTGNGGGRVYPMTYGSAETDLSNAQGVLPVISFTAPGPLSGGHMVEIGERTVRAPN